MWAKYGHVLNNNKIVFKETHAATSSNHLNADFHSNNVLPKSDEENSINQENSSDVNATIIGDKNDGLTSTVVSSDALESEKYVKNASSYHFRHIDHTKIQSDTKDIIDDSGDNIINLKRVITTTTTTTQITPTVRTTLPNTFSNAGGNGGKLDDVQTLTSDSVIRKRHRRRRQGRYLS